jgi:hypothetical protein
VVDEKVTRRLKMQDKRMHLLIMVFVLAVNIITSPPAWPVDEAKLASSGEKVVEAWGKLLSNNVDLVSYDRLPDARSGYWAVRRHKFIDGSMAYDVKKTDSLVSPYMLIVSFKTLFLDNASSPNANGHYDNFLRKWFGFKTVEEALSNTKSIDFPPDPKGRVGRDLDLKVYYAYQKGIWVLKGGDRYFKFNFEKHLTSKENGHYFKELLAIPVE